MTVRSKADAARALIRELRSLVWRLESVGAHQLTDRDVVYETTDAFDTAHRVFGFPIVPKADERCRSRSRDRCPSGRGQSTDVKRSIERSPGFYEHVGIGTQRVGRDFFHCLKLPYPR